MKTIEITQSGLDELKQKLSLLKTKKRPQVIARIKFARTLGDLSENSEYDEARNEQSFTEGLIQDLEDQIKHTKVVNRKNGFSRVVLGSTVVCQIDSEKETYQIVSSIEADPTNGKISIDSPFGKSLLGKKKGDLAKVSAPAGELTYKIVEVK